MYPLELKGVPGREARRRAMDCIAQAGLPEKILRQYPKMMSGGEQQRVAIARALAAEGDILLADEPTGNLDSFHTHEIMSLLEEINQRGTTVVAVTHSQEMVAEMNKRVITMDRGAVISDVGGEAGGTYED